MSISSPNPLLESGQQTRLSDPCIIVIFGATGDLTARKLVPALYNLAREGQLSSQFACIGFARKPKSNEDFRAEMKKAVGDFSRVKPLDESFWQHFEQQIFYHISEFHDDEGYSKLKKVLEEIDVRLGTRGNRVFYLSTQPSFFTLIAEKLHKAGLIYDESQVKDKWSRVIIEKPFGHDLTSALALQHELLQYMKENQIYRIDHYLGKETVQNILVFRFANSLFESLWNNRYIDHVQITVAEDLGIGGRGKYFEEAGLLRDMLQNHTMQLLSLISMEPPVSLDANAVRDEKVKVLQALRPFGPKELESCCVRGQYGSGFIDGDTVLGYRQEKDVNPKSCVETFIALKLYIDNWRWDGVPFYLRSGKRLPKKSSEIAIVFKDPPGVLFQLAGKRNEPNVLVVRIQPDEGIALRINCKVPGPSSPTLPVKMDFRYGSYFGMAPPEAYERLILDCILGDSTLFAREDEVFNSWKLLTPLLDHWAKNSCPAFPNYQAGTWGPSAADEMLARDNRKWRLL
ncbi:MAG: glucose-6-phosphate dehydrogenase [Simkania sp.]|nr:glucose-6-phosphate dehydrogenase [Simkania sp.]